MILKRTEQEVLDQALTRLKSKTNITNTNPGAIARALIEAWSPEIPDLYKFGEWVLQMGFLSKATGEHLELVGGLFSYPRRLETYYDEKTGEPFTRYIDDDTYRYEISQRPLAAANANETALRLALLAVPGVDDIVGKEYALGTGSFAYYVIPSNGFSPEGVKASVEAAIANTKAYGIKPLVILPKPVPLFIRVQLLFHETTTSQEKERIRFDVKAAIFNKIGNMGMGEGLIYNDLVQEIMNISDKIVDFEIVQFYLNREPVLLTNQRVLDDERIVMEDAEVI